jgi:DNA-binding LacI/PurR family transcriptional regulator
VPPVQDPSRRGRRVTIADIAREAGVSKGAVSYALNGLPGVSASTRARVLAIANELGWYPNRAARALSAARADACGLVVARPARMLALEPFFMEFVSGVEAELSARSIALTIQLAHDPAEEIEIYRRWYAERRVDGVMVYDPRVGDPRIPALVELGLPAVVVGGPIEGSGLPSVWHDESSPVVEAVRYLGALGHTRIARVAGLGEFEHTVRRTRAFEEVVLELGVAARVVDTDYTPESGARATRRLLSLPEPPTGIVFDSDVLAVTGLGVAHQMGFSVPDDVSIVAWDDSLICQVVHPPLTAMTRDIPSYGSAVARRLLAEIDGQGAGDVEEQRAELVPRGSTGPVR